MSRPATRATRIGAAFDAAMRRGAIHAWTVTASPRGAVWTVQEDAYGLWPVRQLTTAHAEAYLLGMEAGLRAFTPIPAEPTVRPWLHAHLEDTDA